MNSLHLQLQRTPPASPALQSVALAMLAVLSTVQPLPADDTPANAVSAMREHCLACHEGKQAEAGLDLHKLARQLKTPGDEAQWVRIIDRVAAGEMPPAENEMPDSARTAIVQSLSAWVREFETKEQTTKGRVRGRRLTNLQLERSLQDLLGVDIPLSRLMPEEPRTDGFTTVADGQAMSHFQLEQHLAVVDAALDEAFRRALTGPDEWNRTLSAETLARQNPRRRTREPELIDGHAVTWKAGVTFYGRLPVTTAREDGWYRFTVRAKALNKPEDQGVWCSVRSGPCVSSAPLLAWLGAFEATTETREVTFEGWLRQGHMLEIRPGDATLKSARFQGGQIGTGEGAPQMVAGVAIESIRMSRIHLGAKDQRVRSLLFNEQPVKFPQVAATSGKRRDLRSSNNVTGAVVSEPPQADMTQLVHRFARRAFRRPVDPSTLQPYIAMAHDAFAAGEEFGDAVRGAYRAVLCSPRFLYIHETPGVLDQHALATRLSYMLWNRPPDWKLHELARDGKLSNSKRLREQVDRMLNDPRGSVFVEDFADQWLDLNQIDFTEPDRRLYPGFDPIVQNSMLEETHAFLREMLTANQSVTRLVAADSTFLNSRLAKHYQIKGVTGDETRKVSLKAGDHRGGLLTHGSILKVSANGTTTSPVIRGVWISERLLGQEIPPPPTNVPAIEPDIRGAKSIREQLAKHKSDAACASCHTKIDPPGFALENFDPAGRWRDSYGRPGNSRKQTPIDASFQLPDGRPFKDLEEFQRLVASTPAPLARNVVEKLITYGTGAPIRFSDRTAVDAIVAQAAADNFGFRSLLYAVIESPIFRTK